jgi:hypothetical protein
MAGRRWAILAVLLVELNNDAPLRARLVNGGQAFPPLTVGHNRASAGKLGRFAG